MAEKVIKSGFKTTEFWVSILVSVGAILATVGGVFQDHAWLGVALATASTVAYAISRGLAKK